LILVDAAASFPEGQLLSALAAVSDHWSAPTRPTDTNPNYRLVSLVTGGQFWEPSVPFMFVLDQFAPVWSAWVSRIEPGGLIHPHIDQGPYRERWQIPIQPAGVMNGVEAVAGVPFRVNHWEPHSVENPTDRPRIHLVIDRDVIVDAQPTPFRRLEGDRP
jgi:hypothetical protein